MNAIDHQLAANWIQSDARPPLGDTWDRADWQRLWLGTQIRPWRTLAVVAADRGISTFEVAHLITSLGRHHGEAMDMADVRDVGLDRIPAIAKFAGEVVASGMRLVFAARSITENLATIPIARGADCVLLCVSLGSTRIARIEEVVSHLGKECFLGSVLIKNTGDLGPSLSIVPSRLSVEALR